MPSISIQQVRLAQIKSSSYSAKVAANSATGFGDPNISRRTSAPYPAAGAFFVPAATCYGGCAWDTFGYAGCLLSRFANLRTAATHNRLATVRGSSTTVGAPLMKHLHALNPPPIQQHIASLKARAISALHADSSLSVRLARYNEAMRRTRALETKGGAQ
ncbi:hypothetical protein SAMN05216255_0194 [Pseudomonas segetis]|uniref:Uncharacterized protein n=2 Tax=Pseudomonas segetis TaxID=298908 RepID=A0A238Z7N1_9PSED|nr:hypothetical protein SAMN05216255_0194 [Pseudomonas segetis]